MASYIDGTVLLRRVVRGIGVYWGKCIKRCMGAPPHFILTKRKSTCKELDYIKKALQVCQFPQWALNQLQHKFNRKHNQDANPNRNSTNKDNNSNSNKINKNITIVVPYMQCMGEGFKKSCHSTGIQVHFKGMNTLRTLLVKP